MTARAYASDVSSIGATAALEQARTGDVWLPYSRTSKVGRLHVRTEAGNGEMVPPHHETQTGFRRGLQIEEALLVEHDGRLASQHQLRGGVEEQEIVAEHAARRVAQPFAGGRESEADAEKGVADRENAEHGEQCNDAPPARHRRLP